MRRNIYIREENEEAWQSIPTKERSAWINGLLSNLGDPSRIGTKRKIGGVEFKEVLNENMDTCEHGAGEGLCKHSKCKNSYLKR